MRNDSSPYTKSAESFCARVCRNGVDDGTRRRDAHRRSLESSPRVRRAIRLQRLCPRTTRRQEAYIWTGSNRQRLAGRTPSIVNRCFVKYMSSRRSHETHVICQYKFLLNRDRPDVLRTNT